MKDMSRSNFTPMERFHEILNGHGLQAMNVGINHIRIFRDGRKIFDYYPLRMKLFDYHNWYQLTYPSFGNGDGMGTGTSGDNRQTFRRINGMLWQRT